MKLQIITSFLVVSILAGGYLWFVLENTPEESGEDGEVVDNNYISSKQEVPDHWQLYQSSQFNFTLQYPPEGSVVVEAEQVKITYLGPDNTMGSEITDGFTFFVDSVEGDGRTLAEYVNSQFIEESRDLVIISEPVRLRAHERDAYSYQLETRLGPSVTHVVLETGGDYFFTIRYMVAGENRRGYEEYIDLIIKSLQIDE